MPPQATAVSTLQTHWSTTDHTEFQSNRGLPVKDYFVRNEERKDRVKKKNRRRKKEHVVESLR